MWDVRRREEKRGEGAEYLEGRTGKRGGEKSGGESDPGVGGHLFSGWGGEEGNLENQEEETAREEGATQGGREEGWLRESLAEAGHSCQHSERTTGLDSTKQHRAPRQTPSMDARPDGWHAARVDLG